MPICVPRPCSCLHRVTTPLPRSCCLPRYCELGCVLRPCAGKADILRVFLRCVQPPPVTTARGEGAPSLAVGSLSHIVNHSAHGYTALPDWSAVKPDPTVRDPVDPASSSGGGASRRKHGSSGKKVGYVLALVSSRRRLPLTPVLCRVLAAQGPQEGEGLL